MLIEDDVRANREGTGEGRDPRPSPEREPEARRAPARAPLAVTEGHRWLLGALLGGAGLVHLVMAPSHLGTSAAEGIGFVVAGWLQLILAGALVRAPARWLLRLAAGVSLVLVAAWAVSRTAGLPFGAHAGHAESAGFVDLTAVGLELAAVLAVAALLRGRLPLPSGGGLALVAPLAIAALATGAIASPSSLDHAGGAHGEHAAGAADAGGGHAHGDAAAEDDLGFSLLSNGHQHAAAPVALDDATQAELDGQLAWTERLVEDYPTIADAEAAGYLRAGPFAPGLGTHFLPPDGGTNDDGVMDEADMDGAVLIYDGLAPTSPLAGFMFLSPAEPAEGWAGGNDTWHYHESVCFVVAEDGIDTPFGADLPGVTEAMCDGVDGQWVENTGYMVHVWTVPGYESPDGVFTELNPAVTCEDGTYYIMPIEQLPGHRSACRDTL